MRKLNLDASLLWRKSKKSEKCIFECCNHWKTHVVTTGRRSGSGRIITENYDKLVAIYESVPLKRPLPFGVLTSSNIHNDDNTDDNSEDNENVLESVDRETIEDNVNNKKQTNI